jgi:hypothetical protein
MLLFVKDDGVTANRVGNPRLTFFAVLRRSGPQEQDKDQECFSQRQHRQQQQQQDP